MATAATEARSGIKKKNNDVRKLKVFHFGWPELMRTQPEVRGWGVPAQSQSVLGWEGLSGDGSKDRSKTEGYLGTLVWGLCLGGTELRGFWPGCLVRECS